MISFALVKLIQFPQATYCLQLRLVESHEETYLLSRGHRGIRRCRPVFPGRRSRRRRHQLCADSLDAGELWVADLWR